MSLITSFCSTVKLLNPEEKRMDIIASHESILAEWEFMLSIKDDMFSTLVSGILGSIGGVWDG